LAHAPTGSFRRRPLHSRVRGTGGAIRTKRAAARTAVSLLALLGILVGVLAARGAVVVEEQTGSVAALAWPPITRACRPWTRWWWMGSAVDERELTRHLELFHQAGRGGVEISPIYGVQGAESRNLAFLSPPWVRMLGHTLREARRLDMGVDMITGTGWPFGGPSVTPQDAAAQVVLTAIPVDA